MMYLTYVDAILISAFILLSVCVAYLWGRDVGRAWGRRRDWLAYGRGWVDGLKAAKEQP